jgi:hypothetical protein
MMLQTIVLKLFDGDLHARMLSLKNITYTLGSLNTLKKRNSR